MASVAPAVAEAISTPPAVVVQDQTPVRQIDAGALRQIGAQYKALFERFAGERMPAEQKWLKNLRQYLGIYDPEIERLLPINRSRAYPRLTRIKCISMLSRLMNLMFPGNEDNWELDASPSPEMDPADVAKAVRDLMAETGVPENQLTQEFVDEAVNKLAATQAKGLTTMIKDQLLELGGDQTRDWIGLNRQVCDSGIKYGIGVLEGPYVRKEQTSGWGLVEEGVFKSTTRDIYKPQYDFLPVWDFYPDMAARSLPGEGYFIRKVVGRAALRKLGKRADFFEAQVKEAITNMPGGNYRPKSWETELKTMGLAIQSNQQSAQTSGREKYEIIVWKGSISAQTLSECGVDVPPDMLADDVDAELWMVDNYVIKAAVNTWRKLGVEMQQVHIFSFDEDDTSPIGQGIPGIVRDSQLSVCAATRMSLDNASVTCGPNVEVNTALMRADQDLSNIEAYKVWYRDDDGLTAQFPAVRSIEIQGHLAELESLVKMFLEFAEMETFIGPQTGGDMTKMPSEPMRTAAGASMARGDAALPFKDIVRNYDSFTQSVIWSLVNFNKQFNPDAAPKGDYDVIPRGATSLIAKEVRGAQIDMLSQTLTPEERDHVDDRKFVEAKFAARDLQSMLVSPDEAKRRKDGRAQVAAQQADQQSRMIEEQIREAAANAFKHVTQGQKNAAGADKTAVEAATGMIDHAEAPANDAQGTGGAAH
jgi:hypothetical protein